LTTSSVWCPFVLTSPSRKTHQLTVNCGHSEMKTVKLSSAFLNVYKKTLRVGKIGNNLGGSRTMAE
jgi:hypothetical protein